MSKKLGLKPYGGVDKAGNPIVEGCQVKFVTSVRDDGDSRYKVLAGKVGTVTTCEDVGYVGVLQIRVHFTHRDTSSWCHFEELLVV